jgi:hypothetical protein
MTHAPFLFHPIRGSTPALSEDSRNTAYPHNARAPSLERKPGAVDSHWHPRILSLVQRDYSFLGYRYAPGGMLYRGLHKGLTATLANGAWLPSVDEGPLGALERELGVFLFSHELSDALSVSRLWEDNNDAAILVFNASEFDARWRRGEAAILGFAEPGVIFKYPFFVEPLELKAHSTVFLRKSSGHPGQNQVALPSSVWSDRAATASWLVEASHARGEPSAVVITTNCYPFSIPTIAIGD